MELTQNDVNNLVAQGYTQQQIQEAMHEDELDSMQQPQAAMPGASSMFAVNPYDNLVKWQLELDNILERVEHIIRGDRITHDPQGNIIWERTTDIKHITLNDYGVSEVMRILSIYLNRNTILSNYSSDEIDNKVYDFGCDLSDLFYMKYESMGLDDPEKRKEYPMLMREIIDTVHSAYARAYHGGERESLREARQVTQSEQMSGGQGININTGQPYRQRGALNPLKYLLGGDKK